MWKPALTHRGQRPRLQVLPGRYDLAVVADLRGGACYGALRELQQRDDFARAFPVVDGLDVDPDQGEVRILDSLGEPRLQNRRPEFAHPRAIAGEGRLARDGNVDLVTGIEVAHVDHLVVIDLLDLAGIV